MSKFLTSPILPEGKTLATLLLQMGLLAQTLLALMSSIVVVHPAVL